LTSPEGFKVEGQPLSHQLGEAFLKGQEAITPTAIQREALMRSALEDLSHEAAQHRTWTQL